MYPTDAQAEKLREFASGVRFVYNLALEQRRDYWRQYKRATGRHLNYASQGKELTELRKECEWLRQTPASCQHGALQDLDKAFQKFYRGGGYPRFRKAGVNESFEVKAQNVRLRPLNRKWGVIKIPSLGWVKFRDTRSRNGESRSVRITCEAGRWFACVWVRNDFEAPTSTLPAVGIDRGVALPMVSSDGRAFTLPAELKRLEEKMRRGQRVLSRRKLGSARQAKQRRCVADCRAKAARIRTDWQHKRTTDIVRAYGTVIVEDLSTRSMTARAHEKCVAQKRGLNRAILNVGWHGIEAKLAYKLEERGGTLIKINPAYTSQTCSACGAIDKRSRESQARFACTSCDHEMNADINAAINILRQGMAVVDGGGCAPVEARTDNLRLVA